MIRFVDGHRAGEIFTGEHACRYAEDIMGGVIYRYELIDGEYRFDRTFKRSEWGDEDVAA